jgi:hypothetical protein
MPPVGMHRLYAPLFPVARERSKRARRTLPCVAAVILTAIVLALAFGEGVARAQVRTSDQLPAETYGPIGREIGRPLVSFVSGDTIEIVAHRFKGLGRARSQPAPSSYLEPATPQDHRAPAFSAMTHFRTIELPLASRVIFGADRMAGTAAALGGLGLVGGLWDGKTAGYLMGAGAVLGALWGGTLGADNPAIRIGVDPNSAGPEPAWRRWGLPNPE